MAKAFCICCRNAEAVVSVDMDGTEVFRCIECSEEFNREDVQAVIDGAAQWVKLLKWLDAYPKD